jgi:hypothetical protein
VTGPAKAAQATAVQNSVRISDFSVGFEVLTTVVIKSTLGYNAMKSAESQPTFGGTCGLHLEGLKIKSNKKLT